MQAFEDTPARTPRPSEPARELHLVVAVAANRVIGRGNALPWHLPADLKHFRRITTGHAIVMGRRTWDAISRPLPDRQNIVITRQADFRVPGADVVHAERLAGDERQRERRAQDLAAAFAARAVDVDHAMTIAGRETTCKRVDRSTIARCGQHWWSCGWSSGAAEKVAYPTSASRNSVKASDADRDYRRWLQFECRQDSRLHSSRGRGLAFIDTT